MTEIWYKTSGWGGDPIKPVKISKQTTKFITLAENGRRTAKMSSWDNYFPTFAEAANYLEERYKWQLRSAKEQVIDAQENLDKLLTWLDKNGEPE